MSIERKTLILLAGGLIAGIVVMGSIGAAMDATNTEAFCISCHEMRTPYEEIQDTGHYWNRTGVRATCPDCHVPNEVVPMFFAKIRASKDVYHKILGTINTPEKYEARRLKLAQRVWGQMEKTNSRECRNCHDMEQMDFIKQDFRAADRHDEAIEEGRTCIECHKGIAHRLPAGYDPAAD